MAFGHRADALDGRGDQLVGVDRLQGQACLARLDHGELQQLVHQLREVIGLALDLGGEVTRRRRILHRSGGERLG